MSKMASIMCELVLPRVTDDFEWNRATEFSTRSTTCRRPVESTTR